MKSTVHFARDQPTTCVDAEPFALQVTDDSMEPEFARGCIIIIDPTGRVCDGAYVLAEVDNELIFRMLREDACGHRLEALNPACDDIALPGGLAAVRGVVVQRAGRRRSYHKRYED